MTAQDVVSRPEAKPARDRGRRATALGLAVIGFGFLLPLRGLMRAQGPPMEEGFMLAFPQEVLRGGIPNVDFLHLYGPGSLWVLAGAFKVFGTALTTERMVGLAQQVGLVLGVFFLARRWGALLATIGASVTLVVIVPPIGLTALAWVGAVAFALWSLHLALLARETEVGRRRGRLALASGVLAGLALLYRPDLVLALALGLGVALWRVERPVARRVAIGGALGLAPYLVHLATAGPVAAFKGMVLDPVVYLRGGRRLPIPPRPGELGGFLQKAGELQSLGWPIPSLTAAAQLTAWFFLFVVAVPGIVLVGRRLLRDGPTSLRPRALLAVGALSVGLLPQALQRTDSTHFAWATCVPLGLLPVAVSEVLRRRRPTMAVKRRHLLAGVGVVVVLVGLVPYFIGRTYADYSLQSFGIHRQSYKIEHAGRTFYYGRTDVSAALKQLLPAVDRVAPPGSKLFVGTIDLRKTPYSDAFLYYLFPDLRLGTYYIEMDPGVANRPGSRLARDLAGSDVAILSAVFSVDWQEPNDSLKLGSDAPNQVLRDHFCLVDTYGGLYQLWKRCR